MISLLTRAVCAATIAAAAVAVQSNAASATAEVKKDDRVIEATMSAGSAASAKLPDWVTVKPQSRLVMLALDAGIGDENDGLNFNHLSEGSHRLLVPRGWTVVVRMKNADERVAHSALVTRVYRQEEMPDRLNAQDAAFPGATTPVPFTGTAAGGYAEFTFSASEAGHYFVACGVHTHMQAGMWFRFDISDALSEPAWQKAEPPAPDRPADATPHTHR